MIMKKENINHSYSSPRVELMTLACEQAFLSGSIQSVEGAGNEDFVNGGIYDGGWN